MNFNEEFPEKLKEAKSIVFFTGAGISAESGIPTFRGKDGIWNRLKPEELANFNAFLKNPDMVWEWYQHRRNIIHETGPNPAHIAIAEFEKYYEDVCVVTQNVDNLHRRAGSKTVYELHGNIERNYCIDCTEPFEEEHFDYTQKSAPRCKECGGLIRPDVVWFGEFLPQQVFSEGERKAAESDICFIVGTSAVVYPAAFIPLGAKRAGSYLVEINITQTEISGACDYSLFGKAGEIMPQVLEQVKKIK
jgi:NAD-dependent deacetylase